MPDANRCGLTVELRGLNSRHAIAMHASTCAARVLWHVYYFSWHEKFCLIYEDLYLWVLANPHPPPPLPPAWCTQVTYT